MARVFGCARVVFNDSLRLREECHAAGEKINDSEIQRRVITLAKATPEREWLAEAPSVALVQACNDARRAYRNWFDSLSGQRKGRRIGHPRPRRKHDPGARLPRRYRGRGAPVRGRGRSGCWWPRRPTVVGHRDPGVRRAVLRLIRRQA